MTIDIRRYAFTVDEFARMGEAGIFTEDDRVELIDGEIREMTPIGAPHAVTVSRLNRLFIQRLPGDLYLNVQNPVQLDRHTEPQPDLAVARGGAERYAERHPAPGDLLLVVEVADSSLAYDRAEKAPRYARAGIPETWVVDVAARAVIVHAQPRPDGYASTRTFRRGEVIASAAIPGLRVGVDEAFG